MWRGMRQVSTGEKMKTEKTDSEPVIPHRQGFYEKYINGHRISAVRSCNHCVVTGDAGHSVTCSSQAWLTRVIYTGASRIER